MAYDSATAVEEAGNAYKRALAVAQQKRNSLNAGAGLNADGSLDATEAGRLGSIYQTGLAGQRQYDQAASADAHKGFRGTGGLASRGRNRALAGARENQAVEFRNVAAALGANTQESQLAGQDYRDQVGADGTGGIIGRNAAWDLAQTLLANPVMADTPPVANAPYTATSGPTPAQQTAMKLTGAKTAAGAVKKNPTIFRAIRNNRF